MNPLPRSTFEDLRRRALVEALRQAVHHKHDMPPLQENEEGENTNGDDDEKGTMVDTDDDESRKTGKRGRDGTMQHKDETGPGRRASTMMNMGDSGYGRGWEDMDSKTDSNNGDGESGQSGREGEDGDSRSAMGEGIGINTGDNDDHRHHHSPRRREDDDSINDNNHHHHRTATNEESQPPTSPPSSIGADTDIFVDYLLDEGHRHFSAPNHNYDTAIALWQQAAKEAAALGLKYKEARAWTNLSCGYRCKQDHESAVAALDVAWDVACKLVKESRRRGRSTGGGESGSVGAGTNASGTRRRWSIIKDEIEEPAEGEEIDPLPYVDSITAGVMEFVRQKVLKALASGAEPTQTALSRLSTWAGKLSPRRSSKRSSQLFSDASSYDILLGAGADLSTPSRTPTTSSTSSSRRSSLTPSLHIFAPTPLLPPSQHWTTIPPPIFALFLDIATNYGNVYFGSKRYSEAVAWHHVCLYLCHEGLKVWPVVSGGGGGGVEERPKPEPTV
ncbi:hypothetical protein HK104_007859, partial [Borealophlyctis nickersoniae]